jgi:uncharacterized protein involved in exopolysaccharide biosynthesis
MLERASASLSGTSADGWASEQAAAQQVSLAELVPAIKRSFWVIAGCVFAAVLLALFYIAITPSSYVATAQLLIGSGKQPYLLQDNVVDLTIDNAQVESQVEVLRSERVANDVVGALGLEHDPDFRSDDASTDYERHRIALARFRDGLSTRRVGQSYVIEVSFRSTDPDKAARITNAITAAYIRDQLSAKTDVAQQASQWMQERVTELSAKLNTAAAAVQKFRAENGISDNNTNNQPRLIDKLTGLEAQAQAYRKLYESFLQKLTENQQQESYPVSNARVITEASTPLAKTYPKSKLILLLSSTVACVTQNKFGRYSGWTGSPRCRLTVRTTRQQAMWKHWMRRSHRSATPSGASRCHCKTPAGASRFFASASCRCCVAKARARWRPISRHCSRHRARRRC